MRSKFAGRTALPLVILVLLTAALRLPLLNIPLERDEGEYAYIAWRLDHNELPYRDWVDQKPPGIFWVYRAALQLALEPIRAIHLMGLLWAAASAVALFFLARRFLEPFWATMASVLFTFLLADPLVNGPASNTELFMLFPLILSLLALLRAASKKRHRAGFIFLAGALTGIATAFKQVAAVNLFLLVALYPMLVEEKRLKYILTFAVWLGLGAVAAWIPWIIYFQAEHGLSYFIRFVFTHNFAYVAELPWLARWKFLRNMLAILASSQMLIWIFALTGFVMLLRRRRWAPLLFLAEWLATSFVGVSASGYYFPHYFQQLLPALCLSAAWGLQTLANAGFWRTLPMTLRQALLGIAGIVLPCRVLYPFLFIYTPAAATKKIYPPSSFAEMIAVGDALAKLTKPDDRVFFVGAEPEVFFYARRVSATRYIFLFPLYGPYRDASQEQHATAEEITRVRPAAAIWFPEGLFVLPGSDTYFTNWTQAYLHDHFETKTLLLRTPTGHIAIQPAGAHLGPADAQHVAGAILLRKVE